jgi:hypothetical protein
MERLVRRGLVAGWIVSCVGCNGGPAGPPDTGVDPPYGQTGVITDAAGMVAVEGAVSEFTVTSTEPERIDVVHTGYEYPDCGTYIVVVDRPELRRLVVDYGRVGDTAEECGSTAVWTFTYSIHVDPGDWTIELLNTHEKRTVTVQ